MFLVGTHLDHPSLDRSRVVEILREKSITLENLYPTLNFIEFFAVSCTTGDGIDELRKSLENQIKVFFFLEKPNVLMPYLVATII